MFGSASGASAGDSFLLQHPPTNVHLITPAAPNPDPSIIRLTCFHDDYDVGLQLRVPFLSTESVSASTTSNASQTPHHTTGWKSGYHGYSPEHLCEFSLEQRYNDGETDAGRYQVEQSRLWTDRQVTMLGGNFNILIKR